MSKDIEKFTNWRAISESDYVTMFIKTWFAFVATLRHLYPDINVFAEDGKPRGDRPFTNKFKQDDLINCVQEINIKDFTGILEKLYIPSREKVAQVFSQYFFTTFYRVNETFHYSETQNKYTKEEPKKFEERIHFDLKIKNRFDLSLNIQLVGSYYGKQYNENIKSTINLKDIIKNINISNLFYVGEREYLGDLYKKLYEKIQACVYVWCDAHIQGKYSESLVTLILSKIRYCIMKIGKQFDLNFNPILNNKDKIDDEYALIKQRPTLLFTTEISRSGKSEAETEFFYQKLRDDLYIWFIDFVVSLRNALFHEIIDPLDKEWQLIYKNAYLALKELLDATTNYLIKKEIATFVENKYIEEDNDDLFEKIKMSLESEAFDLKDYELIDGDIEINQINVSNIDFYDKSSISINNKSAVFRCRANILADGRARIFDYDLSQYDREDDKYYYIVHDEIEFNNAEASVELEVEFEFDLRDIEKTSKICKVKPLYFGSIRLSLSENEEDNKCREIYPDGDDGDF